MSSRRLLIVAVSFSLISGCAADPRNSPQANRSQPQQKPRDVADGMNSRRITGPIDALNARRDLPTDRDTRGTVEALAKKIEASAKALDPSHIHRSTAGGNAAAAAPSPDGVLWPNPSELTLSSQSPGGAPDAAPTDMRPAEPVATNRRVALDRAGAQPTTPQTPAPVVTPIRTDEATFASANNSVSAGSTTAPGDDALNRRLAQHVRDYPSDTAGHLDYQLLRFLCDAQVPQLAPMTGMAPEDRDVLVALLDGLSNFRTGLRSDPNMLLSRKVRPLLETADRVRGLSELTIPTIALCKEVRCFGVYEPLGNTFKAGQDLQVILYCEVENFSSRQNDKHFWETKLSQEVVVYTETGFAAWRDKSDIPTDLSRNRRHDFFVYKKITLPKTLGVGRYVLKVSVVDDFARRIAENSVPLNLVAQ